MQELLEVAFGKENIKVVNYRKYDNDRTSFEIHSESANGKIAEINPYVVGTVFFDGFWELSMLANLDRWTIDIKPTTITEFAEEDFFKILKEICDELVGTILTRRRFTERVKRLKEDPTAEIRDQRLKGLI
jgi:hypothetical protein